MCIIISYRKYLILEINTKHLICIKHIFIYIISKQNEIRHKLLQYYINSFLYNSQLVLRGQQHKYRLMFMVFNATLSNISVISWQSVLLVGETRVPGENNRLAASQ